MPTEMPELHVMNSQKTITIPAKVSVETYFEPHSLQTRLMAKASYSHEGAFRYAERVVRVETDGFSPSEMQQLANLLTRFVTQQLDLSY
jgi:hypothetical protein